MRLAVMELNRDRGRHLDRMLSVGAQQSLSPESLKRARARIRRPRMTVLMMEKKRAKDSTAKADCLPAATWAPRREQQLAVHMKCHQFVSINPLLT
ncbi:unnamed protein product [Fusarium venenatum]|uniref:Uncharacterized protein n=1 Tax=Fusarium venenatum TaxID=56646 RepID=A0A2L2TV53_9HYPO|nr:uncharacterized protein FVRRES_01902 [Fusarium venenatum]CEI65390.1 unnamed protein product [Fusarium venenatum]